MPTVRKTPVRRRAAPKKKIDEPKVVKKRQKKYTAPPPEQEVVAYSQSIGGCYSETELSYLYEYLAALPDESVVVEIGSYFGRSSSVILQVAPAKALDVTLIDKFVVSGDVAENRFNKMVADLLVKPKFTLMKMLSSQAAKRFKKDIDLLHIDEDHTAEGVERNCKDWLPKLRSGGVVIFHDYARKGAGGMHDVFPGVKEMVDKYCGKWQHLGLHDSQAKFRKP